MSKTGSSTTSKDKLNIAVLYLTNENIRVGW